MKRVRVLLLVRKDLVPRKALNSSNRVAWRTEYDVRSGLVDLGHDVRVLPVDDDARPIVAALERWRPRVVFNLLSDLRNHRVDESHIVSLLELYRAKHAGCNARGLVLAQDKALTKRVLAGHGVPTPRFEICHGGRLSRLPALEFPLIVKAVDGAGSAGISQRSVVKTEAALRNRLAALHDSRPSGAIVEEYVDGRELTIGVLGNRRPTTLPIWETFFGRLPAGVPRVATAALKWNDGYRRARGVTSGPARGLSPAQRREIAAVAVRAYRVLGLSGFARIDFRLDRTGRAFMIDVNPNPDVGFGEDFARSAKHAGIGGPALLQRILDLALAYRG